MYLGWPREGLGSNRAPEVGKIFMWLFFLFSFFTMVGRIFMWLFVFVGFFTLAKSSCGCFCLSVFYLRWQDLNVVVFCFSVFLPWLARSSCLVCLSVSISVLTRGGQGS